jgi:penicillin amidase
LGTDEVESSDELMLVALVDALAFLRSEPTGPGEGGFGTDVMDDWLWGLRHWVRFESVLAELVGDDPTFSVFTDPFTLSPARLPLASGLEIGDPRRNLPGFPRPGDQLAVDAANPGTSARHFDYGSGPVFRMVVALSPDGPEGYNILPGGQSGLKDSPFFDDQAKLWLGNKTQPMRFTLDEVMEGAIGRETFHWVDHRGL